jgi:hypothetical protein
LAAAVRVHHHFLPRVLPVVILFFLLQLPLVVVEAVLIVQGQEMAFLAALVVAVVETMEMVLLVQETPPLHLHRKEIMVELEAVLGQIMAALVAVVHLRPEEMVLVL